MNKLLPLLFLFVFTSCSGASQIPLATETAKPLPSPVIIKVVPTIEPIIDIGAKPEDISGTSVDFWYALSGEQAALMEQSIASFSLSNPYGITVVSKRFNTLFEMDQTLNADGSTPGMVMGLSGVPFTDKFEPVEMTPYTKLSGVELEPENMIGGIPQFSLPFIRSARTLIYNTSFAKELGFNTPPTTFEEFKIQTCAANAYWRTDEDQTNDGFGGYLLDGDPNWQDPLTWMINGSSMENDQLADGKSALDDLEDLRNEGCSWYLPEANEYEQLRDRKALVVSIDVQDLSDVSGAQTRYTISDTLSIIAYPGEYGALLYGFDLYIPRTDPNTQLAGYLFARWLLEDAQQSLWVREAGILPVTITSVDKLLAEPSLPPTQHEALGLLANSANTSWFPLLSTMRTEIGDAYYQWVTRYPFTTLDEVWAEIMP